MVIADSSKLGRHAFARVCPIEKVHTLVTDAEATDADVAPFLAARGLGITRACASDAAACSHRRALPDRFALGGALVRRGHHSGGLEAGAGRGVEHVLRARARAQVERLADARDDPAVGADDEALVACRRWAGVAVHVRVRTELLDQFDHDRDAAVGRRRPARCAPAGSRR